METIMSSDEASCSDCKLEMIEKQWTQLMLNWINNCVNIKTKIRHLDLRSLVEVTTKYRQDICSDDIDRALLISEDIEAFVKYKYPILRLWYLAEAKDYPKKLYIMSSIVLFHCCTSSLTGVVDREICAKMGKDEQELILKFCENLSEMEPTINNVESAIRGACEQTYSKPKPPKPPTESLKGKMERISELESESGDATANSFIETIKSGPTLKFKSSVTVMPSVVADTSSYSRSSDTSDYMIQYTSNAEDLSDEIAVFAVKNSPNNENKDDAFQGDNNDIIAGMCQPGCACTRCSLTGPCCGVPGTSMARCLGSKTHFTEVIGAPDEETKAEFKKRSLEFSWKAYFFLIGIIMLTILIVVLSTMPAPSTRPEALTLTKRFIDEISMLTPEAVWQCENNFCQKVYHPDNSNIYFESLSRCTLLCMGPQLWPYPTGYTSFSKNLIALATNKIDYKFQALPSEIVHEYLAEAFYFFFTDLARLEKIDKKSYNETDLVVKKLSINIEVESDADPRLRYNTDESYTVKIETNPNLVQINITSPSFCGVRHGLETLSQIILLDQSTGHLITLSNVIIKDTPSYKYRGLMVDTARNYIPIPDLMRTIDAMGANKLNTFHWRISDATSFPWYLPEVPELFLYGAYDKKMVYMKDDIRSLVQRAGVRGIRVVIEVAAPGPVGRAWSWTPDAMCPRKNNMTCDNFLCTRLKMQNSIFDILEILYKQILELTKVDDVFHLSDGLFSLTRCSFLIDDREGFLEKALDRLKTANNGFLPRLPIVWYTPHLMRDLEATTWDKLGVQLNEWVQSTGNQFLSRFKVVHSSRWDLSCEMKQQRCTKYRTWQEMYAWKSWRNIEVFSIEGGEAVLWTDLVDSGNLDYHLWPRVAAVAERLWSDNVANATANGYTYVRLDVHRWRMLLRAIKVQPIWPVYCSFNPLSCIKKLK